MLEIRGADDIDALFRRINEHADAKAIKRELYRGTSRAARDLKGPMIEVIPAALPRRGGLAAQIQGSARMRVSAKGGRYAGASVRFTAPRHDIRLLAGQRLRHPVFGNRDTWVTQTEGVDPAVFINQFEQQAPVVRDAILQVLNDIARKVAD